MRKRKLLATLLATTLVGSMFVGCGKPAEKATADAPTETDVSAPAEESEETVELSFYMMNGPVNDQDRIMEKVNEITKEEINATVNLVMIDGATYAEKMNLMINSGDAWDLAFTASWGGINFFENATKGAYADLTELIPQYAPQSYARIPEGLWEGVKVNDKIYGIVNYQQWGVAKRDGIKFRSDIAEEVGFDWKAVKGKPTIEAMELVGPFLGAALEKHPDMIGWETSSIKSFFANEPLMWDMEAVGDESIPGWVRFDDPGTVINQFDTTEFKEYARIMRDWYEKGYVRKDGATVKDTTPDRKAAKFIAESAQGWPDSVDFPGNADVEKMSMTEVEDAPAVTVSTSRTVIPASAGSTSAVSINAESPNVIKSLELIELLNTNDELYVLLTQGEEGTDYVYADDGSFELVEGKYNFNWNEWQVGQSYSPDFTRALYEKNEAGDKQKEAQTIVFEADREAEVSPVTGFTFDPTPVKTQLANCASVTTEMVPAISSGSVDPEKSVAEFLERLEVAGVNEIIAEKQAQLDAWSAANN